MKNMFVQKRDNTRPSKAIVQHGTLKVPKGKRKDHMVYLKTK
jgi:hypothetical protein